MTEPMSIVVAVALALGVYTVSLFVMMNVVGPLI